MTHACANSGLPEISMLNGLRLKSPEPESCDLSLSRDIFPLIFFCDLDLSVSIHVILRFMSLLSRDLTPLFCLEYGMTR